MKIELSDVTLNVDVTGPDDAPAICLGHCFGSNHQFFDAQMDALQGFRVVRFDARGHGGSTRGSELYNLNDMAADVVGVLDALGIAVAHYCGVSMGGMVGQYLALNFPERVGSLALVNTTSGYSKEQVALWRERADIAEERGISEFSAALLSRWFTNEACESKVPGWAYMHACLEEFDPRSFASAARAISRVDTQGRLGEIRSPTIIIASPTDPGVPAQISQSMAHAITTAQLHWLAPSRHLATLEHPVRFATLLREFLSNT